MDDNFSWSDSVQAVFGSCLHCFRTPHEETEDENPSHHHTAGSGTRVPRARADELEGLLADSDEAETLSLHSNIGDRNRRRKKKPRNKKGIRVFGFDLFGRPPIYLSEDEDGGLTGGRGSQRRRHSVDAEAEDSDRVRTLSTSTLDSDASPLDLSTINELSAAQMAASLAREEEERKAKEERRKKRKERKERRKNALVLTMDHGEGEFEGFPVCCSQFLDVPYRILIFFFHQGSGTTYGQGPSPLHLVDTQSSTTSSVSPLPHEEFGGFEQGQLAHERMFDDFDDADDHGADFGAATYTKRATSNSNGSGSESRSRTSASGSNADPTRYNHHYPSQPQPHHSRSNTVDNTSVPPLLLSMEGTPRRKKKSKSGRSSRHSVSSTSQSTSLASPPPQQGTFPFNAAPMLVSDENGVIQAYPQDATPTNGFPSVGLSGAMRRKTSEAGVFLARRGDD